MRRERERMKMRYEEEGKECLLFGVSLSYGMKSFRK